jgi:hypothetical protein
MIGMVANDEAVGEGEDVLVIIGDAGTDITE